MDTRTNMIIAKGKIVTANVSYCALNPATNKWDITFNGGKDFHYSRQNVTWLKNPASLNPSSYNVRFEGKVFDKYYSYSILQKWKSRVLAYLFFYWVRA